MNFITRLSIPNLQFPTVCKQNMSGTESKAAQSDAVAASPDFRAKSGDFAVQTDNLCLHTSYFFAPNFFINTSFSVGAPISCNSYLTR
jgi:hypothetical protein